MIVDKRELILAQLKVILGGLANIQTVARNRGLLDQDMRPAAVLMDGDEASRLTGDKRGRQRMSPTLVTMKPQLFIVLKSRKPHNEGTGEDLNAYRMALIDALATDPILIDLVGANGDVSYEGCVTDLKSGQLADGTARLDFAITYVLDPNQM